MPSGKKYSVYSACMMDVSVGRWSCFLSEERNFFGVFRVLSAVDTWYIVNSSIFKTVQLSNSLVDLVFWVFFDGCGEAVGLVWLWLEADNTFSGVFWLAGWCAGDWVGELAKHVSLALFTSFLNAVNSCCTQWFLDPWLSL